MGRRGREGRGWELGREQQAGLGQLGEAEQGSKDFGGGGEVGGGGGMVGGGLSAGSCDGVGRLLDRGAAIIVKDGNDGLTPLALAASSGHYLA